MFKQKNSCAVSTVLVALAAILLTGCDAGVEAMGTTLASFFGSAYAAQREPAADSRFMAPAMASEHRHFAIYNAYRSRFDSVPGQPNADATGASDGVYSAAAGDGQERADGADSGPTRATLADNE